MANYITREGISWFFTSYLDILNIKGNKDKLMELFNEYKKFIENNVEGVEVVPDDERYYTAVFKVSENLSQKEKFKIAERIAELTMKFNYNHLMNDEELSYLREIFNDFIQNSKSLDGFRYYKYEVTAPWGDEYTIKAYLSTWRDTQVVLEVYIFKGEKMIASDSVPYSIGEMTKWKRARVFGKNLPVVAGFLKGMRAENILRIGILVSHENFKDRGKIYLVDLYNDQGPPGIGKGVFVTEN